MAGFMDTDVRFLKGVGEKRAELFAKLGVNSVGELLNFYPRAYEDWTTVEKIENMLEGGTYCIRAVLGKPVSDALLPGGRVISKATVYDDTGALKLVWFNNRYISRMLAYGGEYFFFGKLVEDGYGAQMISPAFTSISIFRNTSCFPNDLLRSLMLITVSPIICLLTDCPYIQQPVRNRSCL